MQSLWHSCDENDIKHSEEGAGRGYERIVRVEQEREERGGERGEREERGEESSQQ